MFGEGEQIGLTESLLKRMLSVAALVFCAGCGAKDAYHMQREAVVYGEDGRRQYYELSSADKRDLVRQSALALLPREVANQLLAGGTSAVMTWGEAAGLCADEPFAAEPAAAFCSGVLVARDLMLTSEHCLRAMPLSDWVVAFDYYYASEGQLQLEVGDVFEAKRVLALEVRDDSADSTVEQLDFAFVQLDREVGPDRKPAQVYTRSPPLSIGERIYSISTGGGVPLKWDESGSVVGLRDQDDYFVADTDTSRGSSGSGVFDERFGLLGVLGQGGADLISTAEGCAVMIHADEGKERATLAHRAVAELCRVEPGLALCDEQCPQPCSGVQQSQHEAGCAVSGRPRAAGWWWLLVLGGAVRRLVRRDAQGVSRANTRRYRPLPRTSHRRATD